MFFTRQRAGSVPGRHLSACPACPDACAPDQQVPRGLGMAAGGRLSGKRVLPLTTHSGVGQTSTGMGRRFLEGTAHGPQCGGVENSQGDSGKFHCGGEVGRCL